MPILSSPRAPVSSPDDSSLPGEYWAVVVAKAWLLLFWLLVLLSAEI